MDYRNNKNTDTWDEGVFGTGNTMPPKSYSGIIALLLVLVIFLSGIVSLLSFMNIKLFQELSQQKAQEKEIQAPMSFSDLATHPWPEHSPQDTAAPSHLQPEISINLNKSPQSVENLPQTGAMSWQEIYQKNIPSVVSVLSTSETGALSGSGIIVSESGFIVTTACTVSNVETITITLSDGRSFSAVVVGADPVTDLAVIYVDAPELIPAEFGDSDSLRVGDAVAAIGDPLGVNLGAAMTQGMISAINRDVQFLGKDISLIQSDVSLNTGNTGGPLINCYGQVIGINTTHIAAGDTVESIGFAIPSATVKGIVDQLIAHGYVAGRPTLGISGEAVTKFDQYYFQIPEGLYIESVTPGTAAWERGISAGDILVRINGQTITDQKMLDSLVNSLAIGDTVAAVFFVDGEQKTMQLTVTEYVG
jgi:serine protease Do